MVRLAKGAVSLVLPLLAFGCTPAQDYATVCGTVSSNGQPLSGAVVTFVPTGTTGGPKASASIFDGEFEVSSEGKLRGGRYIARISFIPRDMLRQIPADQMAKLPAKGLYVSPQYDEQSTLVYDLFPGTQARLSIEVELRHLTQEVSH